MRSQLKIVLIVILLTTFVMGCSKKCDDFNREIIDWMPYKVQDKIMISDSTETETLTVTLSEINHTDKVGRFTMCACEDNFIVDLSSASIKIQVCFNQSMYIKSSLIFINGESLNYSEQLKNLELNGHTYNDIIIYKNSNQSIDSRFEKIIISKFIGIVEIIGLNENWIVTDYEKRITEISEIDYKSSDCN